MDPAGNTVELYSKYPAISGVYVRDEPAAKPRKENYVYSVK